MTAQASPHDPLLRPVYRTAEVRALEKQHAGDDLMERAGAAAAGVATAMLARRSGPIVVLAGPGNNGGDGLVMARVLRAAFHDVIVVFSGDATRLPPDAARAHAAFVAAGGSTHPELPVVRPALIVDALFGLGFDRALPEAHAQWVRWANAQAAPTLALDIPTGLRADTGIATAPAIRADATATFIGLKPGLLTAEGPDLCGAISVHELGIAAPRSPAQGHLLEWPAVAAKLPEAFARRVKAVHKGSFGTVGVIGGRSGMIGAALLAGRAALRCGAGKVRVGFVDADVPGVDPLTPELMLAEAAQVLEAGADVWVVGCGMGTDDAALAALRRTIDGKIPLVLDADALNVLASDPKLARAVRSRNGPTIVTPHPAEAARLLDSTVAAVQRNRLAAAESIAHALRAHVVLKGTGTMVAHPDRRFDINGSGNPGLAFAGSGDVLAGMIGACLAQHADAVAASRIGVCLHGAAADALVARGIGPIGLSGAELVDAARELLNRAAATTRSA
jgi:ADP-dependent NAD(P)H-hydrate dehydratase / NAD(P)H-hydrate epimerase